MRLSWLWYLTCSGGWPRGQTSLHMGLASVVVEWRTGFPEGVHFYLSTKDAVLLYKWRTRFSSMALNRYDDDNL